MELFRTFTQNLPESYRWSEPRGGDKNFFRATMVFGMVFGPDQGQVLNSGPHCICKAWMLGLQEHRTLYDMIPLVFVSRPDHREDAV